MGVLLGLFRGGDQSRGVVPVAAIRAAGYVSGTGACRAVGFAFEQFDKLERGVAELSTVAINDANRSRE